MPDLQLTWTATGVDSLTLAGNAVPLSGSTEVALAVGQNTVAFAAQVPAPAPTATLTVTPSTLEDSHDGSHTAVLTWTTAHAGGVVIDNVSKPLSGSMNIVGPPLGTRTFTLSALGPGGVVSTTATLTVIPHSHAPLPHPDNPEQQDEHLYLLGLVPVSAANGLDKIVIPPGETRVVDGPLNAEWIRVQGTLDIRPGAHLRVDTIVTDPQSTLTMTGGRVTFVDGPLRSDDPLQLSRGLIAHGTVNIHGEPVPFDPDNLTRSVVFESENPLGTRGHVMMMHNASRVSIEYAAFENLGRTRADEVVTDPTIDGAGQGNPRGRYALHYHRGGVSESHSRVVGSVVSGARKLAFVNHSSNVVFDSNIVDGFDGSAYFTETGNEVGSWTNNIARNTTRVGGAAAQESQLADRRAAQDFGHSGVGYWLQGPGVRLDGNRAENVNTGVMMLTEPLKENGVPVTLNGNAIDRLPVTIENQLVDRAGAGIVLNHLGTGPTPIGGFHQIRNCDLLNVGVGVSLNYTTGVNIENVRAVGNIAHPSGYGFTGNGVEDAIHLTNVEAKGFTVGIKLPYIDTFNPGFNVSVNGAVLQNLVGVGHWIVAPHLATPITYELNNVTYEPLPPASLTGTGPYGDWPWSLPAGRQWAFYEG